MGVSYRKRLYWALDPVLGPTCRPAPPGTLSWRQLGPGVLVVPGGPGLVAPGANPTNPNFSGPPIRRAPNPQPSAKPG